MKQFSNVEYTFNMKNKVIQIEAKKNGGPE